MSAVYDLKYRAPSTLSSTDDGAVLALSANVAGGSEGPFFQGQFRNARLLARALGVLARVVGERWFDAQAVARSRQMDPVVTAGAGHLRFEGFSGCRSIYARVDVLPEGMDIVREERGTTNVDFNEPMRRALGRVRSGQDLSVCVSQDEFILVRGDESVVEKKVKLPLSWIKGFASVQALTLGFEEVLTLDAAKARRLLSQVPSVGKGRDTHWLLPDPRTPRISRLQSIGAIQLTGGRRLSALQELLPFAQSLTIHASGNGSMSFWTLSFEGFRLGLMLSPEVWRGFSGEGAALEDLAQLVDKEDQVLSRLADLGSVDPDELAIQCGITLPALRGVLARQAAQGLVGYDQISGLCYERILPGSAQLMDDSNPRLVSARKLLENECVTILLADKDTVRAKVDAGEGKVYDVALDHGQCRCSCYWYGKFRESRGPCSHVLAVKLAVKQID